MNHRRLAASILACALCIGGYFAFRPRAPEISAASTQPVAPAPPRIGEIYLGGDIQRPGVYTVGNPGGPKSLRAAVLTAGIDNPKTAEGSVIIRRDTQPGEGDLIKIDLGPLLRTKTGDTPLLPKDVIEVDVTRAAH